MEGDDAARAHRTDGSIDISCGCLVQFGTGETEWLCSLCEAAVAAGDVYLKNTIQSSCEIE